MKTKKTPLIMLLFAFTNLIFAQMSTLPSIELHSLDETKVTASEISNDGKPLVLIFWKTNERESCEQLIMINEAYKDFMEYQGVKVIAVCIDCVGKTQHIKPFVYGHNLDIEVYIDKNGDFKRSMNILYSPSTILFDHQMNINCQFAGYCSNVEDLLCTKIEQCLANID
jgi:peroxiredoxin